MKKTPFLAYILAAMLSCAGIPHAEASTYYNVKLTDDEPSWDVAENNWYYTYTDEITGVKYACYDLFVEAKDGRLVNGGWSSNIYIRSGAKLTADYLLQETGNLEGSELWRILYTYDNDDYRLHIYMDDNSSLNYSCGKLDALWLGALHFQEGTTVNIKVASNCIDARAIGKYTDRDFTINAKINTTADLHLWNEYTSSVTLKFDQEMSVFVTRGGNKHSPYIDASGQIHLPADEYRTQLNGCAVKYGMGDFAYIDGYLKGTTLISLGDTALNGCDIAMWDTTSISWLLNNVEVREGCSARMRDGYYGGTITLQKGSSLKFEMEIMPAGVDDANWDGGIKIIMKDSSMLDLAGRSLPAQYLDLQGTGLTIKNGTIAGNLTLQNRTLALQDIYFYPEDKVYMDGGATLNLSGQSFDAKHLKIAGKGNIITNGSLSSGALVLENTELTLESLSSMNINVCLNGGASLNFNKQPNSPLTLTVSGTNDIQDKDGLIITSELRIASGSASALKVTGNLSGDWIDMWSDSSLTATGDVIANRITGNFGSRYIGAKNIDLNTIDCANMKLTAENSVRVNGDVRISDKLDVFGKNVTLYAVEIQSSSSGYAQIVAAEDVHITQGFIGERLDVTAGGAITLASLGSEANPIRQATIISTEAGVTIEEFYGRTDADLPLQVEAAGKVVIGESLASENVVPVVTGNMNIRYTGSGSGTESWDVEMLCELHGNLTVNAAHGRVSALTVKSNEYCDIYARQINLVSFVGDKMTLRASVSASVTKAAAADSLRIIGLNGELPDITIQSDMIAASMIELDGKNITATGIFSVLASSCYQISAANNVDIKSTFQGGKLALTAAGAVTLGAVGDSDNPVESANIRSTGGAVNISWGAVASGALSLEGTGVNIGESITAGNVNIHSTSGDIQINKAVSCSSATMEAAGNITVNGQVSGSLTATAGGSITLASFVGDSLAASATGEIAVKDVTITGDQGSSLSSEALVVFNGNAHLQNTTVSAPLVNLGKWGLALTNKSSLEGDVTAAANSYIGLNDSTITGSVSGVETVELENSTITGSVSGAGTVELVNSTIGGAVDFSLLKAEGASRINSSLVLEDDSPCFSFFLDAANSTTPVLALNGDLKLSPDVQLYCITIHLDGTDSLEAGERYALISQTGGKTPDFWEPDNVIVTGLGSSADDLSWQGGTLYFRNGAPLATATWSPGENHIWNTTDKNWTQDGREYRYKDGVDVVFNDTGMGGEVQLEGALAPKDVLVEGTCDYTFQGTGKITGETALTKNGSGTLTVNNANEYTGGTFINGGTIAMKNAQALGTAGITLAGGTLDLGGFAAGNSVTLQGSATICNGTLTGTLALADEASLNWSGEDLDLSGGATLGKDAHLYLNGKSLNNAILTASGATIHNGTVTGNLTLADSVSYSWNALSGNGLTLSGGVTLGNGTLLNLDGSTISNSVTLAGSATIDTGTIDSSVNIDSSSKLTLHGVTVAERAAFNMGNNTKLDLGEAEARLTRFTFTGNSATVDNGKLFVGKGETAQLGEGLSGTAVLELRGGKLDMANHSLAMGAMRVAGDAVLSNGVIDKAVEIIDASCVGSTCKLTLDNVTIGENATFAMGNNAQLALGGTTARLARFTFTGESSVVGGGGKLLVESGDTVTLGSTLWAHSTNLELRGGSLDLNGKTLASKGGHVTGDACMGGGSFNGSLTVDAGKTLTLCGNLSGTEAVALGDKAVLALGGHTLSKAVALEGSASIGGGTLDGNVAVQGASGRLALQDVTIGDHATFTMANEAELDLGGAEAWLGSFSATGQYATVDNGKLRVAEGMAAMLGGNLRGTATVSLGDQAVLNLNNFTLSNTVALQGSATIGNGTLNSALTVAENKNLTLLEKTAITGIVTLRDNATLNLGGNTLTSDAELGWHASIGNGTIGGRVSVDEGIGAFFFGETHIHNDRHEYRGSISAGATAVGVLANEAPGLLKELSVSDGLIAGTGRAASLADGLDIRRMGYDLKLENLVLTENNSISVGYGHTITLNNVTIKLSNEHLELLDGVYHFNLGYLINCDLVMENVLMDASDLTLPQEFDPATTSVAFDFGDDVTIKQATGLDMRLGNYWSPSVRTDDQGRVLFTNLVETPEPTTGALSLLALAALAARRRRK